jgi:hypothetical protein
MFVLVLNILTQDIDCVFNFQQFILVNNTKKFL